MPISPAAASTIILLVSSQVFAIPQPDAPAGLSMSIKRRASRTPDEWATWAKTHREALETKYGKRRHNKRAEGTNLCSPPSFHFIRIANLNLSLVLRTKMPTRGMCALFFSISFVSKPVSVISVLWQSVHRLRHSMWSLIRVLRKVTVAQQGLY